MGPKRAAVNPPARRGRVGGFRQGVGGKRRVPGFGHGEIGWSRFVRVIAIVEIGQDTPVLFYARSSSKFYRCYPLPPASRDIHRTRSLPPTSMRPAHSLAPTSTSICLTPGVVPAWLHSHSESRQSAPCLDSQEDPPSSRQAHGDRFFLADHSECGLPGRCH